MWRVTLCQFYDHYANFWDKTMELTIINHDVFGTRLFLKRKTKCDQPLIIFMYRDSIKKIHRSIRESLWISIVNSISFIRLTEGKTLLTDWYNSMYLASIFLSAFSVCKLIIHNIGQFVYEIMKPVTDRNNIESITSDWFQPPANSSLVYHSIPFSG